MKKIITICFMLIAAENSFAQQITFQKIFTKPPYHESHSAMTKTNDNGYILTGSELIPSLFSSEGIYLLKLDSAGNFLWQKDFGDTIAGIYAPASIELCSDGGFILCGDVISPLTNNDAYLIRTDLNGNILWFKIFGKKIIGEYAKFAIQTFDGGFAACGTLYDTIPKCFLLKTDANGILQWTKSIADSNALNGSTALHLNQTNDNGYIICGASVSPVSSDGDNSVLIKTDSFGNTEWMKSFGTPYYDAFKNGYQTADGGFIIGGDADTTNDSIVNPCFLLVKTDTTGIITSAKTFGISNVGYYGYYMTKLLRVSDGTYQMVGLANGISYNNLYTVEVDSNGNYLTSKTHGHIDSGNGINMVEAVDSGFFISGLKMYASLTANQSYLIKTDKNFNSFCSDSVPSWFSWNINLPLLSTSFAEYTDDSSFAGQFIDTVSSQTINTICFSTGLDELNQESKNPISIYPNPFSDELTIKINNNELSEIILYDIISRKLLQQQFTNTLTLNTSHLSKGIYIYELCNKNGVIKKGKVVKD